MRKRYYQPTVPTIGEPVEKKGKEEYLNRLIRRSNRAAGYVTGKEPYKWYFLHADITRGRSYEGTVVAHTKSEARALIKKEMGISKNKRLPHGILIERKEVCLESTN